MTIIRTIIYEILNIIYFPIVLLKNVFKIIQDNKFYEEIGISTLNKKNLKKLVKSDTLVIVGSGNSLKSISESQWEELEEFDILMINFAFLIGKKCDFLFFQFPNLLIHRFKFRPLIKFIKKQMTYNVNSTIIIRDLRDYFPKEEKLGLELKEFINDDRIKTLKSYPYIPFRTRISQKIYLKLTNFFLKPDGIRTRGGSFASSLFFSSIMGYKNVIMIGFDFNSPGYFYEDKHLDFYDIKSIGKYFLSLNENRNHQYHPHLEPIHGSIDSVASFKTLLEYGKKSFNQSFFHYNCSIIESNLSDIVEKYTFKNK
jgi:hypothetical protein